MAGNGVRALARRGLPWAFGLLDQGLWSVTSFLLTLAAARGTGPVGLGAVTVGFSTALLALGLQRSLVLDPFLAAGRRVEAAAGARAVLTLSLGAGALAGLVSGAVGVLLSGPAGLGLRAFAPFLVPVLAHDALRAAAYRADRTGEAAWARLGWLVTTAVLLVVWSGGSASAVAAAWGIGALPACLFLARRLRCLPATPRSAARTWRRGLARLGRPLGLASIIDGTANQVETYVAAAVAGAAALGGFRAAISAFAPLTVLRPALGQVGLPRMARAMDRDPRAAARRGAALSAVLLAACLAYAGGAGLYGRLLPLLFGASFERYSSLLLPLTLSQVLSAAGVGVHLYLVAAQRGGVVLAGTAVAVPLRLAATALLGGRFGAVGLAWAVVIAAGASLAVGLAGVAADARRWGDHRTPVPAALEGGDGRP